MIRKQDIIDRATEWQLRPEVVEKDYVLGWLLAALSTQEHTRDQWVFKGGTCIKKCFFETYRFSEDLDFSLFPDSPYTEDVLRENLLAFVRTAHDLSGIEFPEELVEVRGARNKQGQQTFQGKIGYRGPLAFPGTPKVLFDITQHEAILDTPSAQTVFHPYPDALPQNTSVATYSLHELVAEKTRALYERTRPRDLYDVVYLLENQSSAFDFTRLRALFKRKCESKNIAAPSTEELLRVVQTNDELHSEWENMLAHQLPVLPALDDLVARLPGLISWIDEPHVVMPAAVLTTPLMGKGETLYTPAGIQYSGSGQPLEAIRFAGMNRLLVEFDYHGKHRLTEPYSLRTASTGNLLFYGWELAGAQIKAFKVAEMMNIRATTTSFQPRYLIEFTPHVFLSVPPTSRPVRTYYSSPRPVSRRTKHTGPVYIFECPSCGKKFRHTKNDSKLGKHKMKDGYYQCSGRRGYLVDTEYR